MKEFSAAWQAARPMASVCGQCDLSLFHPAVALIVPEEASGEVPLTYLYFRAHLTMASFLPASRHLRASLC